MTKGRDCFAYARNDGDFKHLRRAGAKGFTLTETLTVLAVTAIAAGFIYLVIVTNWSAYQERIARADLGYDLDQMMSSLTMAVRRASEINVIKFDDNSQTVYIYDPEGGLTAQYVITPAGQLTLSLGGTGAAQILFDNLDVDKSSFEKDGDTLKVRLVVGENLFGRKIEVETATEIYARN